MGNLASSVFRGSDKVVHVLLHNRSFPSDAEWEVVCAELARLRAELAGTDRQRGLVITDGGAPTSKQRGLLRSTVRDQPVKSALVTSSRLALGIGTALSWINHALQSFAPRDYEKALRYLGLAEEEWPLLESHIDEMRGPLHVETLDVIRTRLPGGRPG